MQGAGLSPACRTSHPQGCVGAWHHPGMGNPIPGAPQDPQTPPCPLFGGEPASPRAQSTRAALPQPRQMFGKGEKIIPAAALGKPQRMGSGHCGCPWHGAGSVLPCTPHTPHPDPWHRGLLVLEGSSLYATPSARTLHTPALCTEAGHCHGPLLAPLEQRAQNTAHTPPPRIQPPPGRLPAASSSELY